MTTKKIERELPVKLSADGEEARGQEIARLVNERTVIETELAAFTSGKRQRLREIKKDEKRLAVAIADGVELVLVQCEERQEFSTNTVVVVRCDTGEVVEKRAMTGEERQIEIDVGAKAERKKGGRAAKADAAPKFDDDGVVVQ